MGGIFPNAPDGGLPPNPASPNNPAAAFDPTFDPVNTAALYYGNGCDVRLRPEVMNSIISNIAAVVDGGEVHYDTGRLTNLLLGTQYLIQRGLMSGCDLLGGPAAYTGTLDPPATRYNDFMTLRVVPLVTNTGPVTVNFNGVGNAPLLRNDGLELRAEDLLKDIPAIIVARGGKFYFPYLVRSQVPLLPVGAIDGWVRTDGNDATGDGTANTPQKAFRTINRAFQVIGSKYLQSPLFVMNIRLGIPGTYEAFTFGTFGGNVNLIGDVNNPSQYRIAGTTTGTARTCGSIGRTTAYIQGVTFVMDSATPIVHWSLAVVSGGSCDIDRCRFEVTTGNTTATFMVVASNGMLTLRGATVIDGAGATFQALVYCQSGGNFAGGAAGSTLLVQNTTCSHANFDIEMLSQFSYVGLVVTAINTRGIKYAVGGNSVAAFGTQPIPGDLPGVVTSGGQII